MTEPASPSDMTKIIVEPPKGCVVTSAMPMFLYEGQPIADPNSQSVTVTARISAHPGVSMTTIKQVLDVTGRVHETSWEAEVDGSAQITWTVPGPLTTAVAEGIALRHEALTNSISANLHRFAPAATSGAVFVPIGCAVVPIFFEAMSGSGHRVRIASKYGLQSLLLVAHAVAADEGLVVPLKKSVGSGFITFELTRSIFSLDGARRVFIDILGKAYQPMPGRPDAAVFFALDIERQKPVA